jgi:hypothetical protein
MEEQCPALYAMRGGFLVRPLLIALVFGAVGAILSFAEEYIPELDSWIPEVSFPPIKTRRSL